MNERDVAIATSDIMSLVLKIIEYEAHGTGEGDVSRFEGGLVIKQ